MSKPKPTIRWGIIATGQISTSFARDLLLPRPSSPITHTITAVGTSSIAKGGSFLHATYSSAETYPTQGPKLYTIYSQVYADPNVDIVYIGTPHTIHKQNCLDAIAAGKHVLCEKPFTVNARDAEEVFEAARVKGVFIMEAVWTRFFPLVRELQARLHDPVNPLLGKLHRCWCDFGIVYDWDTLPANDRSRDRNLGAGALLDLGIYPITLARVLLGGPVGEGEEPSVNSEIVLNEEGIDVMDAVTLRYSNPARLAMLSASMLNKTPTAVMRIEGEKGYVVLEGGEKDATSCPRRAIIILNGKEGEPEVIEAKHEGSGLFYEADAVALDIVAGRKENAIMPWAETVRVMKLMDGVRERGGLRYPQDD